MKQLEFFVTLISVYILFIALLKLLEKGNLKKELRGYQFAFPFVALVYGIIVSIFINKISDFIFWILNFIVGKIPQLSFLVVRASSIYIVIINAFIILCFVFLKRIFKDLLYYLWNQFSFLFMLTSAMFYEYDDENNIWILKDKYGDVKRIIKWMYQGGIFISTVFFVLTLHSSKPGILQIPFYPVVGLIILSEICSFIDGFTRSEYNIEIGGEDERGYSVSNYTKLRLILKKTFSSFVLSDGNKEKGLNYTNQSQTYIETLQMSNNHIEKLLGYYFHYLVKNGKTVDSQYISATLDIINHKSVLFSTPFYRDLTEYLFFALNRSIISKEKILIIVGRDTIIEDVIDWVKTGISEVSRVSFLWNIDILNNEKKDVDIGILSISHIFDINIHENNSDFLKEVNHVVILEPSRIVAVAQTALYTLTRKLKKDVQYTIFDKNSDGLVDALSHILKTNIIEVSATKSGAISTQYMIWDASASNMHHKLFPNIARYLGIGSEIALVSLKYGISKIFWLSYNAFSVIDMKWILGQYYSIICNYANLPSKQHRINEYLQFVPNLWNVEIDNSCCVIVEDEFFNVFEMVRQFSTRGIDQSFVNVISSNYLLRDYMNANAEIFLNDPKAIPSFSPDFARTSRNAILELILSLSIFPMKIEEVQKYLADFCNNEEDIIDFLNKQVIQYFDDSDNLIDFKHIVQVKTENYINEVTLEESQENLLYIEDQIFIDKYLTELKNTNYIAEDEKENLFLGTKLFGQVYQQYLPKQFITIDGKNYEIVSINSKNGIILRRSADYIHSRVYYRQIREYEIDKNEIDLSTFNLHNIIVTQTEANIRVNTYGFLEMKEFNDLANAINIMQDDIPQRSYNKKMILKIDFPNITPLIRITLTVLLNELFKTIYPDNYNYLVATTYIDNKLKDSLKGVIHPLKGNIEENSIYIVEDSQLDLGITISFERNFKRFLEIITDYLSWHLESMKPVEKIIKEDKVTIPEAKHVIKTKAGRLVYKIKKFLKKFITQKQLHEESSISNDQQDKTVVEKEYQLPDYVNHYYLLFGYSELLDCLEIESTYQYLVNLNLENNNLYITRKNIEDVDEIEKEYDPTRTDIHFCDFCGKELTDIYYDVLSDGRERCAECRQTAVRSIDEFKRIYYMVLQNYEAYFDVKIKASIKLEMVDTKVLHKKLGKNFIPTSNSDPRVLGIAIKHRDGKFTIYVENGAPRNAFVSTLVHEITHIWQYTHWEEKNLLKNYGEDLLLPLYEGMAKWVEIQYMILIGEKAYAKREEIVTRSRKDEYGKGFLYYISKYPFSNESQLVNVTPFNNIDKPL